MNNESHIAKLTRRFLLDHDQVLTTEDICGRCACDGITSGAARRRGAFQLLTATLFAMFEEGEPILALAVIHLDNECPESVWDPQRARFQSEVNVNLRLCQIVRAVVSVGNDEPTKCLWKLQRISGPLKQ